MAKQAFKVSDTQRAILQAIYRAITGGGFHPSQYNAASIKALFNAGFISETVDRSYELTQAGLSWLEENDAEFVARIEASNLYAARLRYAMAVRAILLETMLQQYMPSLDGGFRVRIGGLDSSWGGWGWATVTYEVEQIATNRTFEIRFSLNPSQSFEREERAAALNRGAIGLVETTPRISYNNIYNSSPKESDALNNLKVMSEFAAMIVLVTQKADYVLTSLRRFDTDELVVAYAKKAFSVDVLTKLQDDEQVALYLAWLMKQQN